MKLYCLPEFKTEYLKIKKNKKYPDLEEVFRDSFCGKSFDECARGDMLYGPVELPFLKKRAPDAAGYRFYFLACPETKCVYLTHLHPKTVPLRYKNVGPIYKKKFTLKLCKPLNKEVF
jgi:hypothetical protein